MTATTICAPSSTCPRDSPVRAGAMAMLPLLAGYAPFALIIGAAAAEHGAPLAGWSGSWLIYGGSAHLATIRALDRGGLAIAIMTGLLINARLLVYSASLARHWREQPRWFRIVAAGLIIDPTWVAAEGFAAGGAGAAAQRRHFLAAGLTLGVGWSALIAVGAVMGARLEALDLDIVVPLCLLALVAPSLRTQASRAVITVAAIAALVTSGLPAGTGLLVAIVAGSMAGLIADGRAA